MFLSICAETVSGQSSVIDSLLRVVSTHTRDSVEVDALGNLASEFLRKDMDKAKAFSYQQIALAKELGMEFGLSAAYSALVIIYQSTGRIDSASYYLEQHEILFHKYPKNKKIATNYNSSAGLFYKNQSKYREALPYQLEALGLHGPSGDIGDKTSRAGQMLNIGNTYNQLGELKKAANYHLQALALFEEVKNKRGQSFCLQGLGNDFFELGQYAIAKKYLFQSEKIKEELGDNRGLLTSWMTLGSVYQQTNETERAMFYFNKALVRARELKLSVEEARLLFNMGSLLKMMKKNDESSKALSEALILARQAGDSVLVSRIKTYLISMQTDMQKEKREEQTLLENIEISLEKGALLNTAEGHFELAKWYESRNQFEKAHENLKQAQQLNDSLKGSEVLGQLKSLEEAYKNDKKEKEITLLKKDQELQKLELQRQRANTSFIIVALISVVLISILLINRYRVLNRTRRLVEMERMRNTIARDLHDDIGSTLSSINIISQMALQNKNGDIANFQQIAQHSSSMMESMSDIVWSINPNNDSFEQVISKMKEFASEILDPLDIQYTFSGEENLHSFKLDVAMRKNLFLIFKEAINNAAKYSSATSIDIRFKKENDAIRVSISDNGKGFDMANGSTGNGLRNMKERVDTIRGKLKIKSSPQTGTEIELSLPLT